MRSYSWVVGTARLIVAALAMCFGQAGYPPIGLAGGLDASPTTWPSVQVDGTPEVVIPFGAFSCRGDEKRIPDIPDVPPRMFLDERGTVHFLANNHLNFAFILTKTGSITHPDCMPMMKSELDADPSRFADREWITSPYTLDGKTVYSLVHDEFLGSLLDPEKCGTRNGQRRCYYVGVTLALSHDGGYRFGPVNDSTSSLVASIPYRYDAGMSRAGLGNPSNIVRNPADGNFYAFLQAFGYRAQQPGACLMRSSDLIHWRYWNGRSFDGVFINPYVDDQGAERHVCPSVIQGLVSSVVYNAAQHDFLAVMPRPRYVGGGMAIGVSSNLIEWSKPVTVMRDPPGTLTVYPALLEPGLGGAGRNFERVDDHPFLYYVLQTDLAHRLVMRVRLKVSTASTH